ncbi:MAG: hypothetical protein IKD29_06515 [Lentisphaeria bacterium]|nr:hypothetical protein [Lentisphaeria bacterium]
MKKIFLLAVFAALFLSAGCASRQLNIGVYRNVDSSREDIAMVFEDHIIMQVKSPENSEGSLAYWTWGGKYSIADDGTIILDMDKETRRRWNFAFNIVSRQDGIVVNELATDNGVVLRYELPKRRSQGGNPVPVGSGGVNPRYQFPSEDL